MSELAIIVLLLAVVFLITSIVGFIGVQKTKNYETVWGYMYLWGTLGFVVCGLIALGILFLTGI